MNSHLVTHKTQNLLSKMNKTQRLLLLKEFEQSMKNELGLFATEFKFSKQRKFKFDYALVESKIAIEINGGQWIAGRHNRGGKGYESDLTKLNLAQLLGWTVLQYTYEQLLRKEYLKDFELIKSTKNGAK